MRNPLSGMIWGIVLGLAIAIVLQQQGIWPADKITMALAPGVLGLLGILVTSLGRSGSTTALTIALLIAVPLTAYGATGLGEIGQTGQLLGGCTVEATSAVDSIGSPSDTSRGDPFVIDPEAGLSWKATSGGLVFDDYPWEMWVDVGGVPVTIDGKESQDNDKGDTENTGDVSDVEEFAESRGIPISQLRGVFMVGGSASVCNGFGFVELQAGLLETIAAKVAAALAVLALIMLVRAALSGRGAMEAAEVEGADFTESGPGGVPPATPGDFDDDGDVDSADYIAWRDSGGDNAPPFDLGDENLSDRDDD